MGGTAADFGAVSTDGLVQRVRRALDKAEADAREARLVTRSMRKRQLESLAAARSGMEAEYALVLMGAKPENAFRAKLIAVLDPRMRGGTKQARFKW